MPSPKPTKTNAVQVNGNVAKFASDDIQSQIDVIKELPSIASAIGVDKTRDELLPFLQLKLIHDKDVLLELLKQLLKLAPLIGGPEKIENLLPFVEIILNCDDDEVQEQLIGCLRSLFRKLSGNQIEKQVVPFIQRLSKDNWSASRATSCGLYSVCYTLISDTAKQQLLKDYRDLCQDDDVSVRLAAVGKLGEFAKCVEFKYLESDFIPTFLKFQEDAEDSVRSSLIDAFFGISAKFIPRNVEQLLMPAMRKLLADSSPKVRHKVADRITDLQKATGTGITKADLVPTLTNLLKDPKAEVRAMAILRANDFCKNLDNGIRESFLKIELLPQLKQLGCDQCHHVRLAACEAPHFGQYFDAVTTREHLLPLVVTLMEDGATLVNRRVVSNLGSLKDSIGIATMTEFLLPIITKLCKDPRLHVRLNMIENLPVLAKQLGPDFFDKQLTSLCIMQASDNSFIISESAVCNLKLLFEILGSKWVMSSIIPQILEMFQESNHVTSLALIKFIVDACDVSDICHQLLPIIFRLANDETTTIRSLASKILHSIAAKLLNSSDPLKSVLTDIKPVMQKLSDDCNPEIMQFSIESMKNWMWEMIEEKIMRIVLPNILKKTGERITFFSKEMVDTNAMKT